MFNRLVNHLTNLRPFYVSKMKRYIDFEYRLKQITSKIRGALIDNIEF